MVKHHLASAGNVVKAMNRDSVKDGVSAIGAEADKRESEVKQDQALKHKLNSLQENLKHEARALQDDAANTEEGALHAEKRAARLLQPGALKGLVDAASMDAEVKQQEKASDLSHSSILDAASENSTQRIELLAAVAEQAEAEREKYMQHSQKEADTLGKIVTETNGKLHDTLEQQSARIEDDIQSRQENLAKLTEMLAKGKTKLKKAREYMNEAEATAAKGEERAQHVYDTISLQKKLIPSDDEAAASEAVKDAEAAMTAATLQLQQAHDKAADGDADGDDKPSKESATPSIHEARLELLRAQAWLVKAKAAKRVALQSDKDMQVEQAVYDARRKKFEEVIAILNVFSCCDC